MVGHHHTGAGRQAFGMKGGDTHATGPQRHARRAARDTPAQGDIRQGQDGQQGQRPQYEEGYACPGSIWNGEPAGQALIWRHGAVLFSQGDSVTRVPFMLMPGLRL